MTAAVAPDRPGDLAVAASPIRLGLVILGAGLFVGAGLWLMLGPGFDRQTRLAGLGSAAVFGLFGGIAAWRLATMRGTVLSMTSEGIRDTRASDETIPWTKVRTITTWQHGGQRIMVLKLDPVFEASLPVKPLVRYTRQANRALGADGLAITPIGLGIDYETMFEAALAFHREATREARDGASGR